MQFGKKKYYTGLVEHIHSSAPEGYETKPIMALLDADPIEKTIAKINNLCYSSHVANKSAYKKGGRLPC